MPIASTDIQYRHSGAATPNGAQSNSNASLGGLSSSTSVSSATNGLFDVITGAENAASAVDYRCIFVRNNHASLTLYGAVVFVASEVAGGANIAIAVDNIGPVSGSSSSAQAATIPNETTAPTGVGAFSTPTTAASGLALGDLGPGQVRAVWIRRSATNSGALNNDGATLSVSGDTAA